MNLEVAKKVLIIRFSALGDVLLTTPILRNLKKTYPNLIVDYFVKSNFSDAVKLNPNLNDIYSWNSENEFNSSVAILRNNNYDFVIDLQNNFRSRKVVREIGVDSAKYIKPNIKKFILVKFKINQLKGEKTIPERYTESISQLELDNKGLELFLPDDIHANIEKNDKNIGIAPGAFHYTKRWPIDYYAKLGNMLSSKGYKIFIFGGKSDREICKKLNIEVEHSIDLSNDNNLFQTAANMKMCRAIVCNDSGLMHTASAVNTPVVSIFGSTVREFGFAPYGVKNIVIENEGLRCRPCTHIGKSSCSKKHFKCMLDLTPEIVLNRIKEFLDSL